MLLCVHTVEAAGLSTTGCVTGTANGGTESLESPLESLLGTSSSSTFTKTGTLLAGTVRGVMVVDVGQKALECFISYSRGASNVHVPAMRAGAAATHVSPAVLGVQVQQAMLDAFFPKHARHDGALGYQSMPVSVAKINHD